MIVRHTLLRGKRPSAQGRKQILNNLDFQILNNLEDTPYITSGWYWACTHFPICTILPWVLGQRQRRNQLSNSGCSRKWECEGHNWPRPGMVPWESPWGCSPPNTTAYRKNLLEFQVCAGSKRHGEMDFGFSEPFFLKEGLHSCAEDWTSTLVRHSSPPRQDVGDEVLKIEGDGRSFKGRLSDLPEGILSTNI